MKKYQSENVYDKGKEMLRVRGVLEKRKFEKKQ